MNSISGRDLRGQITPYIASLMGASNLNINQAKTSVYYCVFTWSPHPDYKPLLNFNGETGTGKNKIMKQIEFWCCNPIWIKAENITAATLRDKLANTKTAFIEEVDKVKEPKECEMWLKIRYDNTSESMTYRMQKTHSKKGNYNQITTANHFGYTILHTQNPFQSIELDRRIIRVDIVKDTSRTYESIIADLGNDVIRQIAENIDWSIQVPGSGSAFDCWLPLMRVAGYLEDNDFMNYAFNCIEEKKEESNESKIFEPKGIVLGEIITRYLACLNANVQKIAITNITEAIRGRKVPFYPDERQVTRLVKQLGFEVYYPHNKAHIKIISREQLEAVLTRQGISTEILTDVSLNEHQILGLTRT